MIFQLFSRLALFQLFCKAGRRF